MDSKVQDNNKMATAPLGKLMTELAVPTVFAQLVNLLYNMVDRIYVGRIPEVGHLALAGLGVTFPVIILISAFAALVGAGGAPQAAICMGKKDMKGAERILGNCITALCILAVVLSVFFYAVKEPLLMLFGASEQTIGYANSYLGIYLLGTISVQIALGLNTFINCQGFAKTGMKTVLIGAVLNIILDPVFIFGLHMGVQGAALATILSQTVSAVWVLSFLCGKKSILRVRKENLKIKKAVLVPVLALGASPFIMQATECLVQLTYNSGMQHYGNDYYVGAMTILFSIMQMLFLPLSGLTQGAQPIISYNFGAGNHERVKKAFKLLFAAGVGFSLVGTGAVLLFPQVFIRLFSDNAQVIEIGIYAARIYLFGFLILPADLSGPGTGEDLRIPGAFTEGDPSDPSGHPSSEAWHGHRWTVLRRAHCGSHCHCHHRDPVCTEFQQDAVPACRYESEKVKENIYGNNRRRKNAWKAALTAKPQGPDLLFPHHIFSDHAVKCPGLPQCDGRKGDGGQLQ